MELKIQVKQAGKRENKIVEEKLLLNQSPNTIKELLTYTVTTTRNAQIEGMKQKEIFDFLKSSKIISEKQAIETAIQAFEDGLIAVFIDGQQYEVLEEKLKLTGDEVVTFVKLTMLSGRMW